MQAIVDRVVQPEVWRSIALHKPVREVANAVFAELAAPNTFRLIGANSDALSPARLNLPCYVARTGVRCQMIVQRLRRFFITSVRGKSVPEVAVLSRLTSSGPGTVRAFAFRGRLPVAKTGEPDW